eukprot:CAMPEP_0195281418 /NCGR_PEP_ID=MMETSP0707-20130614/737_1 /TAXON_ID=33640 /ORGANISM="Asterionellopsis glacialis, Strain CCMP134" /LENGTH=978 /DNA_ID=CAMNT_0040340301 /DNA_START=58 /DNA_END=2994 /DNA_ORIENTATION=+
MTALIQDLVDTTCRFTFGNTMAPSAFPLVVIVLCAAFTMTAGFSATSSSMQRKNHKKGIAARITNNNARAKSTTLSEPSSGEKLKRRINVYWLAGQVFLDYKLGKRKERKLRHKHNIDEDDDDHPLVVQLWDTIHERNSKKLTRSIKKLEGFWIKVGQYLSSRADVMPPAYLQQLSTLQDSMPPKSYQDIQQTLQEQLSDDEMNMLESIDPKPLSTASLAQVHRATLRENKDGDNDEDTMRDVVLKVQHRGVASLMVQDMANLKSILTMVAKFEPDSDFTPIIQEYTSEVTKELDFRTEAQNMEEVRTLLETQKIRAIVPEVVPALVKERVLVMEYCEGFAIRDLQALEDHGVDRELLLRRVVDSWAVQMHVGGVFNADPHPGNILVSTKKTTDDDVSVPVLLDFGLTKRLEPDMKLAFAKLMHASDETDVDALLQSFEEMGLKMNRYDPFQDMAAMQRSFGSTVPQSKAQAINKQKSEEYKRRMEAMREEEGVEKGQKLRNPVDAWPAELVFFGRVTNMLRGLCSRLDVAYPYLNTMANAARQTLQEAVPPEERAQGLIHPSAQALDTSLQQRLVEAVRQLQQNDEMVGLQVCVISQGQEVANIASGVLGTANPRPVTPSTLFCVFSVSKAILTIGVLRLVQEKHIELDDPVSKYWPDFGKNGKEKITIRHVLTHQSGLANALPDAATLDTLLDWELMKGFMEKATPEHGPGEKTMYHYLTYAWLCGGLIEKVTGAPYQEFLDNILKVSLNNMEDHLFLGGVGSHIDSKDLAVLSVERRHQEQEQEQQQHAHKENDNQSDKDTKKDEEQDSKKVLAKYRGREQLLNPSVFNMRKVREAKLPSANGHASAAALAAVFDSLLETNSELLESSVLEAARQPHRATNKGLSKEELLLDDAAASFGLGFQLHDFQLASSGETTKSIGHAGLGGSIVLSLPDEHLTVAIVTNRLSRNSKARRILLDVVFDEFGLKAPPSLMLS